jgi:hypothetical protein
MTTPFGIALALASAQASAPLGIERFDAVAPGMAAAEVRALFPEGAQVRHRAGLIAIDDVAVAPQCEADAEIRIAADRVRELELRGEGALLGRCGGAMLEALVARLGTPDSEARRGETPWRRSRSTYEWRQPGRTLRYVHYTSAGYAGSGLASASWVLTVSGSGD